MNFSMYSTGVFEVKNVEDLDENLLAKRKFVHVGNLANVQKFSFLGKAV